MWSGWWDFSADFGGDGGPFLGAFAGDEVAASRVLEIIMVRQQFKAAKREREVVGVVVGGGEASPEVGRKRGGKGRRLVEGELL